LEQKVWLDVVLNENSFAVQRHHWGKCHKSLDDEVKSEQHQAQHDVLGQIWCAVVVGMGWKLTTIINPV
jgi:hypothetical protein